MLKYLHIENIAIIEKSDIELTDGFNCMTGETGAGKSIVIDAIHAVLGERTSKELIRTGCENATVSAMFTDLSPAVITALDEQGLTPDEDGNLLIRRTLSANGNGTVRVNGQPVTVGILKSFGKMLVNIHGQHDNQNLLDPSSHCAYIDRIADNGVIKDTYYSEFKRINDLRRELRLLETDADEKQRKIDLLTYQIDEITAADIKIGEIEDLKKHLSLAENYEKSLTALQLAYASLNGTDTQDGAMELIRMATRQLKTGGELFQSSVETLENMICDLESVCGEIRSFTESGDDRYTDANAIRDRLDLLYRLTLKYGDSEEKILTFLDQAKSELETITFADQRAAQLSALIDSSTERLIALGEELTLSRKTAANGFQKRVCDGLRYLNMPNVQFVVDFKQGRYQKNGCDIVEFLISANAGQTVKPLSKIASGGELSRVMLVIKSVLADKDDIDTLIFDEVDTGISGDTATKVGDLLKAVSLNRQVLCVTHLPQIAASADTHLMIEKHSDGISTFTGVHPLDENDRITEIARMMTGSEMTENLFNSAKELLDRRRKQ